MLFFLSTLEHNKSQYVLDVFISGNLNAANVFTVITHPCLADLAPLLLLLLPAEIEGQEYGVGRFAFSEFFCLPFYFRTPRCPRNFLVVFRIIV